MIRRRTAALLALLTTLALSASAQAAHNHKRKQAACRNPTALSFSRQNGRMYGTLSWKPGPGTPRRTRYRVLRSGTVIGQTRRHWMRVNLRLGVRYTLRVRPIKQGGKVSRCGAKLSVTSAYRLPSAPQWPAASDSSGPSVTISWQPSSAGDGRIVGYRVLRGGVVYRQTGARSMTVPVSSNSGYAFTVLAVDSNRQTSAPSALVLVRTGHSAPPTPGELIGGALSDSKVGLSWQPSVPARGRVVGYRIFRDGHPVGQFKSTSVTLTNLAASTTYAFTVAAVDGLGYLSDPASVSIRTEDPVPTSGHAYAFLLASTGQSFRDFQAHYQQIGTVAPTYYDCDPQANMTGSDDQLITGWAKARKVRVLPRFNCQRTTVLDQVLTNPTLRQQWLDGIVSRVNASGADGAALDFEAGAAKDRDPYSSFVTDLAARLHAEDKRLVICVSAKTADVPNHPRSTFFDYNVLSAQADQLFVMGWGIHWATSTPGAQDDMSWVKKVIAYIQTLPRLDKYVLGMQLYAMDWPNGGGSRANTANSFEYQDAVDLAARMGVTLSYDATSDALMFSYTDGGGVHHDVWYTDSTTEANRISLAKSSGLGGVGLWRLGREDQRLWSDPLLGSAW
ncbi:MAG: fibronectin type III domain-containing protein [Solirubrobacteraceae bacterium]